MTLRFAMADSDKCQNLLKSCSFLPCTSHSLDYVFLLLCCCLFRLLFFPVDYSIMTEHFTDHSWKVTTHTYNDTCTFATVKDCVKLPKMSKVYTVLKNSSNLPTLYESKITASHRLAFLYFWCSQTEEWNQCTGLSIMEPRTSSSPNFNGG